MGKKIDDDSRGILSRGTEEEFELVKGTLDSRHGEKGPGASLEENRLRKKYGEWYKWDGKNLSQPIHERPETDTNPKITYIAVDKKTKIPLIIGGKGDLNEPEVVRIKLALKRKGLPINEGYSLYGKPLRGFARISSMMGLVGGISLIGGLMGTVDWLEFPEKIDEIKRIKINPVIVRRALERSQLKSVSRNEINRLNIVHDIDQGKNYPTNVLIDSETGILYCVILEATEIFSVGEIVGVKALSLYDKSSYSKIFRDYDEGYNYAYLPGDGWLRVPF